VPDLHGHTHHDFELGSEEKAQSWFEDVAAIVPVLEALLPIQLCLHDAPDSLAESIEKGVCLKKLRSSGSLGEADECAFPAEDFSGSLQQRRPSPPRRDDSTPSLPGTPAAESRPQRRPSPPVKEDCPVVGKQSWGDPSKSGLTTSKSVTQTSKSEGFAEARSRSGGLSVTEGAQQDRRRRSNMNIEHFITDGFKGIAGLSRTFSGKKESSQERLGRRFSMERTNTLRKSKEKRASVERSTSGPEKGARKRPAIVRQSNEDNPREQMAKTRVSKTMNSDDLHLASIFCPKEQWELDMQRRTCPDCKRGFDFFRRKHHCRVCGVVKCGDCTNQRILDEKVCNKCFKLIELQEHLKQMTAGRVL